MRAPICVGIPTHNWMYTQAVRSLLAIFRDELPPGSKYFIEDGYSSCPQKRNSIVKTFLRDAPPDFEYLLLLDADMVFPEGMVTRLLSHAKDVVGVPYTIRFPPFHVVGGTQNGPNGVRTSGGCFYSFTPGQGLVRADLLGGATLLIHRRVLQTVEPPWFDNWRLDGPSSQLDADDFYFCKKATGAGFELWCDTDLDVGHLTVAPVTPSRAAEWREAWSLR